MHLTDLLVADRVAIRHPANGVPALDKPGAIRILSSLLGGAELSIEGSATQVRLDNDEIERVLLDREKLQSTGIGEGVAIPHGAMTQLVSQVAALLIVPDGVDFAAIDERKVTILFAVIGPKRATGEHLKTLARVSRLLRNQSFRDLLVSAKDARTAYDLIAAVEGDPR